MSSNATRLVSLREPCGILSPQDWKCKFGDTHPTKVVLFGSLSCFGAQVSHERKREQIYLLPTKLLRAASSSSLIAIASLVALKHGKRVWEHDVNAAVCFCELFKDFLSGVGPDKPRAQSLMWTCWQCAIPL